MAVNTGMQVALRDPPFGSSGCAPRAGSLARVVTLFSLVCGLLCCPSAGHLPASSAQGPGCPRPHQHVISRLVMVLPLRGVSWCLVHTSADVLFEGRPLCWGGPRTGEKRASGPGVGAGALPGLLHGVHGSPSAPSTWVVCDACFFGGRRGELWTE